jgi:hypothetical protein
MPQDVSRAGRLHIVGTSDGPEQITAKPEKRTEVRRKVNLAPQSPTEM